MTLGEETNSDRIDSFSIIIPAHNEEVTLPRLLSRLQPLLLSEQAEIIVVSNGSSDGTASAARSIPGVKVVETPRASKASALNLGDDQALFWPRLYIDADVELHADTARQTAEYLRANTSILAARPRSEYDVEGSSSILKRYYRARERISPLATHLWGAGVYALSNEGHERTLPFPEIVGDDLWVDLHFAHDEKAVITCGHPVVVRMPRDLRSLLAILSRAQRGNREPLLKASVHSSRSSQPSTLSELLSTIKSGGTALDAVIYAGISAAARIQSRLPSKRWERDASTRANRRQDATHEKSQGSIAEESQA